MSSTAYFQRNERHLHLVVDIQYVCLDEEKKKRNHLLFLLWCLFNLKYEDELDNTALTTSNSITTHLIV